MFARFMVYVVDNCLDYMIFKFKVRLCHLSSLYNFNVAHFCHLRMRDQFKPKSILNRIFHFSLSMFRPQSVSNRINPCVDDDFTKTIPFGSNYSWFNVSF